MNPSRARRPTRRWRGYESAFGCHNCRHGDRVGRASDSGTGRVGENDRGRDADLAAIEKLRQQDIAATFARDPVALTDYWTDDAIRLGAGASPEIGKQTIRASNERQTANKSFKVLSYVPETKDVTFLNGGWAVEWRTYTGSYIDSPGGEAQHVRGSVLMVLKKLPDGSGNASARWGP
jgi:ketosteroid isomerase-like protein